MVSPPRGKDAEVAYQQALKLDGGMLAKFEPPAISSAGADEIHFTFVTPGIAGEIRHVGELRRHHE